MAEGARNPLTEQRGNRKHGSYVFPRARVAPMWDWGAIIESLGPSAIIAAGLFCLFAVADGYVSTDFKKRLSPYINSNSFNFCEPTTGPLERIYAGLSDDISV